MVSPIPSSCVSGSLGPLDHVRLGWGLPSLLSRTGPGLTRPSTPAVGPFHPRETRRRRRGGGRTGTDEVRDLSLIHI